MKIIELLNKIANSEEVPKEIKYKDWLYEFEKDCNDYLCSYDSLLYRENDDVKEFLNDEVEIIEEDKKIKKLDYVHPDISCSYNESEILLRVEENKNKINEIIEVINNEHNK